LRDGLAVASEGKATAAAAAGSNATSGA
jgi:hypothetical protein